MERREGKRPVLTKNVPSLDQRGLQSVQESLDRYRLVVSKIGNQLHWPRQGPLFCLVSFFSRLTAPTSAPTREGAKKTVLFEQRHDIGTFIFAVGVVLLLFLLLR